jgi:hypothetical protein
MELTVDIAGLMIEELQASGLSDISLARIDSGSWLATVEGNLPILVEWTDDPGRLVLSAVLGRPTIEQRMAVFETLLSYNLLWEETGGARMAINGAEGKAVLIYDLHGNHLSYVLLGTVLTNFSQLVKMWRDYVQREAPVAVPAAMSSEMLYRRA